MIFDTPIPHPKPPRKFADYSSRVTFDGTPLDEFIPPGGEKDLGNGVTLIRRV